MGLAVTAVRPIKDVAVGISILLQVGLCLAEVVRAELAVPVAGPDPFRDSIIRLCEYTFS